MRKCNQWTSTDNTKSTNKTKHLNVHIGQQVKRRWNIWREKRQKVYLLEEKEALRRSARCQHVETRGVKIRKAIIGFLVMMMIMPTMVMMVAALTLPDSYEFLCLQNFWQNWIKHTKCSKVPLWWKSVRVRGPPKDRQPPRTLDRPLPKFRTGAAMGIDFNWEKTCLFGLQNLVVWILYCIIVRICSCLNFRSHHRLHSTFQMSAAIGIDCIDSNHSRPPVTCLAFLLAELDNSRCFQFRELEKREQLNKV